MTAPQSHPEEACVLCSLLLFFLLGEVVLAIFFAALTPPPPQISSIFPNTGAMVYLSLGHVSAVEGLKVITHCFLRI